MIKIITFIFFVQRSF